MKFVHHDTLILLGKRRLLGIKVGSWQHMLERVEVFSISDGVQERRLGGLVMPRAFLMNRVFTLRRILK
jgi:hypothetical protein